jgi:alpha-galactosidase
MSSDVEGSAQLCAGEVRFYETRGRPVARYVSSTTVREECLERTRLIGLYWSAAGQVQPEHVTAELPGVDPLLLCPHVFELEIDGQSLHNCWELIATSERTGRRPGTHEGIVELRHQVRPVAVRVVTRLDGTPFLVRYLEITNDSSVHAALSHVSPWSGLLWATDERWRELCPDAGSPFTLGYFDSTGPTNDDALEGNFVWEALPKQGRRLESRSGLSGFGNPFFIVRNEANGETAIGSLAWSANWYAELWRDPARDFETSPRRGLNLGFRMGPSGPAPLRVISPGETVTTPEMHLAVLPRTDFDDCVGALHDHIRASVAPPRPAGKDLFTTAARVVDQPGEWIHREIDSAAEMGVDAFVVDAGWYGHRFSHWWQQRGDWVVGDWIPGGLSACRERAHRKGMLFGLWMEPESVGPESRLREEHPDWLLSTDGGWPVDEGALDLANPEAARYMTESILRIIRENELDCFKLDQNDAVREGGQHPIGGHLESEFWRHYETLYSVFDQVREEFPEIVLETCAAGGGRIDLGMLGRFHYACESDYSQFPRSIRAINGLTLFVPPEKLSYYHNHMPDASQQTDVHTHLRVALFAQPVFCGFGAQDAEEPRECPVTTRRYIRLIREFTGPVLGGEPRVYHHTPDIGVARPAVWCVLEYASQDRSQGYAGIFRLDSSDGQKQQDAPPDPGEYLFRPRGMEPGRAYLVTLDNSDETTEHLGSELMQHGLRIRLDRPNTSELVLYRVKEPGADRPADRR